MSSISSRMAIRAYRIFGAVLYPFMGPFLRFRATRGKEERGRRYERYGYHSAERPNGPIVWFHAASVGESLAVLPLLEHVHELGIHTIMTTGTVTSAKAIRKRLPKETYHQYVPLDLKPAVQRFLDHWKPDLSVFTESEIWPMTVLELAARRIPQVLVNARMSDRSFKRWKGASGLAETLFDSFSDVMAQSELDAERFRQLGARPVTVTGNLKVDTDTLPYNPQELHQLATAIGGRPCWAAISTHDGEEEIAGNVHHFLKQKFNKPLSIVVPRHPDRAEAIATMLSKSGLKVAMRSKKQGIDADTDVYLGDTIGEMGLFLRLANVAFVGRSLTAKGGQNPLEPAMTGTAIISGQHVHNFRDAYQNLSEAGGVRLVSDENMLARNVEYVLANEQARQAMIDAASNTVVNMRGALDKTCNIMDSYLFPLSVKRDLEDLR